ncbi:rho guanine nucleotide exchange factor 28 isoform X2 [Hypomesus transpacificus]|uniref:rho guanine nucleotide exchange factor 28 isoform X2 n=1 Tax=Hypomesus transpacificus TaxID=137520 RepID=UPI001F0841BC|nr:rho guanine nucleotide exchange factor 28 isoform X2 [Hypomesus transpacificus]
MELDRREAPLYGQVEARATLQVPDAEEQAEFYVVLEGSRLTHVTVAKRTEDGASLSFTVPGHDLPEAVSVSSYCHTRGLAKPCEGRASLKYIQDTVQEVVEYLVTNGDHLDHQSYLEVLRIISQEGGAKNGTGGPGGEPCPGQGYQEDRPVVDGCSPEDEVTLRKMDERITLAMANMDHPPLWSSMGSQPREADLQPRETLLHLSVRLGLLHLSRFLIRQPRGQRALTLPNLEGDTPLQLAQRREDHALFRALAIPPISTAAPPVGVTCVWSDSSRALLFCPGSDALTLTAQRAVAGSALDAVEFLRDRWTEQDIARQITELRGEARLNHRDREELLHSTMRDRDENSHTGGPGKLQVDQLALDNVFEEELVLSLDDDEELQPSITMKGQMASAVSMTNGGSPARLVSAPMTQGNDVYGMNSVAGVTRDSSGTDSRAWDPVHAESLHQATDTPPPPPDLQSDDGQPLAPAMSTPVLPSSSPADQALARLKSISHSDPTNRAEATPSEPCDLSPTLVSLEVDSEDEGPGPVSPLSLLPSDPRSSGDERDAVDPSPDLACTRSHSSSSAGEAAPSKDVGDPGIRLRSYSYSSPKVLLRPAHFSREHASASSSSNAAANPGSEQRATSLTDPPQDKREIKFRKRAQSADDEGSVELAESLQHLTLSEFLKEIEEEEWDNYSIPSKVESEKYKVIRTFSFLKSRMSSTRSKNKGKAKEKEREGKDRLLNGHRFSSGACAGPTVCLVCDKPAPGKDLLHCAGCTVLVHKGCKESAPPCLKKLHDKYAVTTAKSRTSSLPQNFTVRESPSPTAMPTSASVPVMTPKERREPAPSLLGSLPSPLSRSATDRLGESPEMENDSWRMSGQSEELLQTTESSASTDSSLGEDGVDACLQSDLAADALDYEAESWSLTVEHKFCKKQDKRVVKRQDVIYELMQTELHHLQTLCVMAEVFRRGMREEVLLDAEAVGRVFPCLDELLLFHHGFFSALRERQSSSAHPRGHGNYLIQHIGDVLMQQFSEENAERMKQVYGEFCSHHNEAVSFFKELQQQNKRFQLFIKQQSINSLARRREIPECILLVTQRITKYPVLLERILQYTQEETEEQADLSQALVGIREVIAAVDLRVREYEQDQRLQDVLGRIENRSSAKLKNGSTFRRQDVPGPGRTLRHQGALLWKTATGRLKDVLALLLTDIIIFLQEKDQKYIFAAVDQKPPVISLQKLIVREVANEERGLFLISASTAGPEMYEVHTSSKEERNTWMRLIREAVESCPEEEEETTSESEEEKRAAEARVQKITKLQESLGSQDQQICSSLEEKLQFYAQLSALSARREEPHPKPRLLVQPHPEEVPQAAVLLTAALREAERLRATLTSRTCSPSSPVRDPETEPLSLGSSPSSPLGPFSDPEPSPGEHEVREGGWTDSEVLVLQSLSHLQTPDSGNINLKVAQSVQSLTQLLYSLQAAVTIQDSCYEVQRLLLLEAQRSPPRSAGAPHPPCPRAGALQEQEKQRNLEKRREEAAAAARLHGRLRQERLRWERECQARHSRHSELEGRLEERESHCLLEAERLRREREELREQLEEYQQSLERLREGQRSVERERERLETQQKLLQSWRHSRQRSLPVMVIPLDGLQDCPPPGQPGGNLGDGSVFVNEAAFTSATLNNRHRHVARGYADDASAHNSLNSLLARSGHRQPSLVKPLQPHTDPPGWARGTGHLYRPLAGPGTEVTPNDANTHRCVREAWSSAATGVGHFPGAATDGDPQLDLTSLVSMETESGEEEGVEENIVYL